MYKKNYNYFIELPSTNSTLIEISANAPDFTMVYTFNQTKGRGCGNNDWISESDKNLTFSFLLNLDLDSSNLYHLNFWVINTLHKFFKNHYLLNDNLTIKWPNDLILNNSKIAGVLIENKIQKKLVKSIIGIGLNVNQKEFINLPNASSILKETGLEIELNKLIFELMDFFQFQFHLSHQKDEDLSLYYNNFLFKKNTLSSFEKNGYIFKAKIKKVYDNGELEIQDENHKLLRFKHKEVKLLF